MSIKLSVLIDTYNHQRYIAAAINRARLETARFCAIRAVLI